MLCRQSLRARARSALLRTLATRAAISEVPSAGSHAAHRAADRRPAARGAAGAPRDAAGARRAGRGSDGRHRNPPPPPHGLQQLEAQLLASGSVQDLLGLHSRWRGHLTASHLRACWNNLGHSRQPLRQRRAALSGPAFRALCRDSAASVADWSPAQCIQLLCNLARLRVRETPAEQLWGATEAALLDALHGASGPWLGGGGGEGGGDTAVGGGGGGGEKDITAKRLARAAWASAAWASAAGGRQPVALLDAIATAARPHLADFAPQGLCNLVWASATVGHAPHRLFDSVAAEGMARVAEFNAQDMSNMAWAFAKAGKPAPELFDALAAEVARRGVGGFKPQELANTAWAFAKVAHAAPALFDALSGRSLLSLDAFSPQGLANTAWAYATAGHAAPELFDAIAAEAAPRLSQFKPQELSILAWACAADGAAGNCRGKPSAAPVPLLFDALAAEVARRGVGGFKPQELANTAWAFAKARRSAPALFDALSEAAAPRLAEFDPQGLANTAWAFASAGHAAPELFDAIAAEAAPRLSQFSPLGLTSLAWAFAVFDHRPETQSAGLFRAGFAGRCDELAPHFEAEHLSQLHQARLWLGGEGCEGEGWSGEGGGRGGGGGGEGGGRGGGGGGGVGGVGGVGGGVGVGGVGVGGGEEGGGRCGVLLPSPELLRRAKEAFVSWPVQSSQMQRQVGEALALMGLSPHEEVLVENGYSLDFVVEWRGQRLGVEVSGPDHFIGSSPCGAHLLKQRQMRRLGWRVADVPYWEWVEATRGGERQRRTAYLAAVLEAATASVVGEQTETRDRGERGVGGELSESREVSG